MSYSSTAFLVIFAILFNPIMSQAKGGDDQDQIILLNDSAAALEDTNPEISESLTKLADEKEKEWEDKNTHKDALPTPVTDKNIKQFEGEIKLLKTAAFAIQPTYPLIANGLRKMAKDTNRKIENER